MCELWYEEETQQESLAILPWSTISHFVLFTAGLCFSKDEEPRGRRRLIAKVRSSGVVELYHAVRLDDLEECVQWEYTLVVMFECCMLV